MIRDLLRRASKSTMANVVVALAVVGAVASVVEYPQPRTDWGEFDYFNVEWDDVTQLMEVQVRFTKRQECHRTIVNKLVRRVSSEGDVVPLPIAAVNGTLSTKLQRLLPGTKHVADRARLVAPTTKDPTIAPALKLPYGQYMVSMVALCEPPGSNGQLLSTDTVQALLILEPTRRMR